MLDRKESDFPRTPVFSGNRSRTKSFGIENGFLAWFQPRSSGRHLEEPDWLMPSGEAG